MTIHQSERERVGETPRENGLARDGIQRVLPYGGEGDFALLLLQLLLKLLKLLQRDVFFGVKYLFDSLDFFDLCKGKECQRLFFLR